MKAIQELLGGIRWDKEFAKGRFEVGYYDRNMDEIVRLSLRAMHFTDGDHYFAFHVVDEEGEVHAIPFHRIREVRKDGELIRQRGLEPRHL